MMSALRKRILPIDDDWNVTAPPPGSRREIAQPAQAGIMPFMGTSPVPPRGTPSRRHCALHG